MKFKSPLLAVRDMERAKEFYREVLGLHVTADFGANVTLTGGVSLQTMETWQDFIGGSITPGGRDTELYFEEPDFDAFAGRLAAMPGIQYVHPVIEHRWGQHVVRFYDPDGHIIEVGEPISAVCRRFLDTGMTEQQVALRMDVPVELVRHSCK
jgi:lactoylglutathione lyase